MSMILSLVWSCLGIAQDSLQALARAFQPDAEATQTERERALEGVRQVDQPRLCELIVRAHAVLDLEIEAIQVQLERLGDGRNQRRQAADLRSKMEPLLLLEATMVEIIAAQRSVSSVAFLTDIVPRKTVAGVLRLAALRAVIQGGKESPEFARRLLEWHDALEQQIQPIETQRRRAITDEDAQPVVRLRKELDPLRTMQEEIRARLFAMADPATQRAIFEQMIGGDGALTLRIQLLSRIAASPATRPEDFVAALQKASRPGDLAILLHALARLGDQARAAGPRAIELLSHADSTVREAAARALAALQVPASIEPLIERLAVEKGMVQRRMAAALEMLTRQKLGTSVEVWRRWLAEQGLPYLSGAVPLGGGTTELEADAGAGYYHGIPQSGHSIVYVIDVSGSMRESVQGGRQRYRDADENTGERRIDACKRELIKALGALPEEAEFNIVYYSDVARLFQKSLSKATRTKVAAAQAFVESLQADGATNIYEGLEVAFSLAGRGTLDRYYESKVETVFLMTDGKPQLPNGVWDDTARILEAVRRWNPYQKVVVHAIGLGDGTNQEFLRQLAEENGGRFVGL